MRKCICSLLCLGILFSLAGCGEDLSSPKTGTQPLSVSDVLQAGMATEDTMLEEAVPPTATPKAIQAILMEPSSESADQTLWSAEDVDIDLTTLSSTMVYSEVYNMLVSPEDYIGKIVKMDGTFSLFQDLETEKLYFACLIADATACCSQGLEFVPTDGYAFPEDYPEVGGEICVVGEFSTYMEGDYLYITLKNAKLV